MANGVGSVSLPFEEFLPRWRGYDRTGTLDLTALNEVGLQLLFQDGPFTLRLREISLVESIAPPADPVPGMDATPSAVRDAIDAATRRADYLVGKGYAAQAAAVLAATSRAVATTLDAVPGTSRAQEALAAALAEALTIVATDEPGRVRALRAGLDIAKTKAAGPAWATDDPDTESEEDATQYVPPAKPSPTDDTTGDHGGSKKKQSKGSEWPVVVGVVLALVFLMAIGIGCSLWTRGARVDPSDSKAAAAAPGEETEEPLQVV